MAPLHWTPPAMLALTFALAATTAHAACSCTAMTVRHTNTVTICSNNALSGFDNADECTRNGGSSTNGCQGFTYAFSCKVGTHTTSNTQKLLSGFEVDASLNAGDNAADCSTGHTLQETITSNMSVVQPNVHAAPSGNVDIGGLGLSIINDHRNPSQTPFPQVGEMDRTRHKVGADLYNDIHATNQLITAYDDHIKWWDHTDQKKESRTREDARWQYRYFSYVKGNPNSCVCVLDIDIHWPSGSNPQFTSTFSRNTLSSTNCAF
jgi:hypothetical protein